MPFCFRSLEIPEIILVETEVFSDSRGFFMETYRKDFFREAGIEANFVQDNHSKSMQKGVLRGLHFQSKPLQQAKLIRVIAGSIFDVAVDIRKESLTYGRWVSAELSAEGKKMLYIPEGFAHGFCVLEENTEVVYKCTNIYSPMHYKGLRWNDTQINIDWPVKKPILSERDKNLPLLSEIKTEF